MKGIVAAFCCPIENATCKSVPSPSELTEAMKLLVARRPGRPRYWAESGTIASVPYVMDMPLTGHLVPSPADRRRKGRRGRSFFYRWHPQSRRAHKAGRSRDKLCPSHLPDEEDDVALSGSWGCLNSSHLNGARIVDRRTAGNSRRYRASRRPVYRKIVGWRAPPQSLVASQSRSAFTGRTELRAEVPTWPAGNFEVRLTVAALRDLYHPGRLIGPWSSRVRFRQQDAYIRPSRSAPLRVRANGKRGKWPCASSKESFF